MEATQVQEELNEASYTYLLLARQMIREDRDAAMHCLGFTEEMTERVASMAPA